MAYKFIQAIDPGTNAGYALGHKEDDGTLKLESCGLMTDPIIWGGRDIIVIEKPTVYPHSKVDPNDLITLAIKVGRLLERAIHTKQVILVEPRTWKGQVPKHVTEKRVLTVWPQAEKMVEHVAPSLRNNVYDAMGLLLWALNQNKF